MPDIFHVFSEDLVVSANGDLLIADSVTLSDQRVLRRLLTNPRDYIWQPTYGAGLPQKVGDPFDVATIQSIVTAQMFLEDTVVRTPAPSVEVDSFPNGMFVNITYTEADSGDPQTLSFPVTPRAQMANLSTQAFSDIVSNTVTAIQAGSVKLLNLTVGSVLRAVVEANAGVILWLQGLITYVLTLTRFATSKGADADSWAADFGFTRLAAKSATGQVTFTRFTTTSQSIVPAGTVLQSADGTQTFTVNADPSNPAYNPALNGYVIAPTVATLTVTVTASTPGSGGNVLANTITSMGQGIPGVDTVTNASAYTNGLDAEPDTNFYARFVLFIAALSKGTLAAIQSAIAGVQQGLQDTVTENADYNGDYDPGFFFVVVSDGSGSPPDSLINAVGTAVENTRALGIRYAVFAPVDITANVSMTITSDAGYDHPTVVGNVGNAITSFINALPLGAGLPFNQLSAVAFGIPGVANVSAILLNGATADIAGDPKNTLRAGTIAIA